MSDDLAPRPPAGEPRPVLGTDPGPDAEYDEIRDALSLAPTGADLTRRRFLQGMVATAGAATLLDTTFARAAAALGPLGATEGVLVVIQLGGGNDGLNTIVPVADPAYRTLRPSLAVTSGAHPLGTTGFALHPAMPRLAVRYAAGKVAVVNGVGNPTKDQSHFSSMATWMAGTSGSQRTTGWLGRYVDTLPDGAEGLRAASVGATTPLHLVGARSHAVSIGGPVAPYGSHLGADWQLPVYDGVAATAATPTGLGALADEIGQLEARMVTNGRKVKPAAWGRTLPAGDLVPRLDVAAALINLDLGVRVISVSTGGSFDTHAGQRAAHQTRLFDLDVAIDHFFTKLSPSFAGRVTLLTFSEFGRRARENGAGGTDHGTAGPMLLVGDRVAGGVRGAMPSLTTLDGNGNLAVRVDFRSVYATVLQSWLKVAPASILGATYPTLSLFRAGPG